MTGPDEVAADAVTSVEAAAGAAVPGECAPGDTSRPDRPGVVVLGAAAEGVADRVTALRAGGRRAAGFVGDPRSDADHGAAADMARELFGEAGGVEPL